MHAEIFELNCIWNLAIELEVAILDNL